MGGKNITTVKKKDGYKSTEDRKTEKTLTACYYLMYQSQQ